MMTKCANCGNTADDSNLDEPRDLTMRVEAGGEMPAGECLKCGALAFPIAPYTIGEAIKRLIDAAYQARYVIGTGLRNDLWSDQTDDENDSADEVRAVMGDLDEAILAAERAL